MAYIIADNLYNHDIYIHCIVDRDSQWLYRLLLLYLPFINWSAFAIRGALVFFLILGAFCRGIGAGEQLLIVALDFRIPDEINFLFNSDFVAGKSLAVPYWACFRRTLRGGFNWLSSWNCIVDFTGVDLSLDYLIFAMTAFNLASLSSKHRCKENLTFNSFQSLFYPEY